jgi:hypothetical protein
VWHAWLAATSAGLPRALPAARTSRTPRASARAAGPHSVASATAAQRPPATPAATAIIIAGSAAPTPLARALCASPLAARPAAQWGAQGRVGAAAAAAAAAAVASARSVRHSSAPPALRWTPSRPAPLALPPSVLPALHATTAAPPSARALGQRVLHPPLHSHRLFLLLPTPLLLHCSLATWLILLCVFCVACVAVCLLSVAVPPICYQ